ncbi:uncharacterized protein ACJ7VT_011207 isoform 2-T2 [Polymixia lowei]
MSDGVYKSSSFLLSTHLNPMVEDNTLVPNCVCLLKKSVSQHGDVVGWLIIITDIEVVRPAEEVGPSEGPRSTPDLPVCKPRPRNLNDANRDLNRDFRKKAPHAMPSTPGGTSKVAPVASLNAYQSKSCANMTKLSEGAIETLVNGGKAPDSVLQVLNIYRYDGCDPVRFVVTMSDGVYKSSSFLLSIHLNPMVEDNTLVPNCVCLLKKSVSQHGDVVGWLIIITDIEVVRPAEEVGPSEGPRSTPDLPVCKPRPRNLNDANRDLNRDFRKKAPHAMPSTPGGTSKVAPVASLNAYQSKSCANMTKLSEGAIEATADLSSGWPAPPRGSQQSGPGVSTQQFVSGLKFYISDTSSELPQVSLCVSGERIPFSVDTGTTISCLRQKDLKCPLSTETVRSVGIGGVPQSEPLSLPLQIDLDETKLQHLFRVSSTVPMSLLGCDLLSKLNLI